MTANKQGHALVTSVRSEEHTSELQSQSNLVCRLLLEKKKKRAHNRRFRLAVSGARDMTTSADRRIKPLSTDAIAHPSTTRMTQLYNTMLQHHNLLRHI